MPLFGNKFSSKKTPARKSVASLNSEPLEELIGENRAITVKLDDQLTIFENGQWIPKSGGNEAVHRSNQKFQKRIQQLEEENNLLKIKFDILLSMLTETTAESHLQQRELEKLRKFQLKNN